MPSAVYCQLCGRKIAGRSKSFRHKQWPSDLSLRVCMDCLQIKPRCRACGIPMVADTSSGLCTTCNRSMRLCLTCSRPVVDKFYEFDGVGPYCKSCVQKRPACDSCGAPLTDERWQLSDGRVTCTYCHKTAIYTPVDATALYEDLQVAVNRLLGFTLNIPTGLALVDRNQLAEVIRRQRENGADKELDSQELDPERTLGIYARRGMRRGIYVQTGLPRVLFIQVAAHEYAHAWQGENCPVLKDELVREGFAEWVAYRILGHYGYGGAQRRMRSRPDMYGRGLKWALDLEAVRGASALIEACRRTE